MLLYKWNQLCCVDELQEDFDLSKKANEFHSRETHTHIELSSAAGSNTFAPNTYNFRVFLKLL